MKRLLLISLLISCGTAFAQDFPARSYCAEGSQLEMNSCEKEHFEKADRELNKLYQTQLGKLRDPINITRLRDAQRAWVAFRDKTCLYEIKAPGEGGSSWAASYYMCMKYRTELRNIDLKEYIACDSGSCPH